MQLMSDTPAEGVGGKAARLFELQAAGIPVPSFVVSPDDLSQAVLQLGFPLAVRSSVSLEDGHEMSFAGQFSSHLSLHTVEEVERAIRDCRRSLHSPPVLAYCHRGGFDPADLHMSVIVQRMVRPELAGVAFTINPATGAEEVVIEARAGTAEDLLAGRAAPLPDDHHLLVQHRPQIERAARRIQRYFGAPQDIEFAIEEGHLYILQARPITRIAFTPEIGQWTNADFRDGGVSSTVCSPLMWSLYEFVWDRTLKGCLRELKLYEDDFPSARMFFGRPYWNLGAVKRLLARLPGFVERDFDKDLNVQLTYEGPGHCTPVTVLGVLRAIPTAWALRAFFRRQRQFDQGLIAGGFQSIARAYRAVGRDAEETFRQLVEKDYLLVESNYFRTIFAASLASLDFKSSFPELNHPALVSGLPPLRHMDPLRSVQAIGKHDANALSRLVDQFAHHCRHGLDVRHPRWDEEREFVEQMLAEQMLVANSGSTGNEACRVYEAALPEALSRVPWHRRRHFRRKLERLRRFVWLREEMRDLSSQMYYFIRRQALQIANHRGLGDDIFFMTFREILSDDRSKVERARETFESYRHFPAPNEIGARYAKGGQPADSDPPPFHPCFHTPRTDSQEVDGTQATAHCLVGIAAGPGTVQGVAHLAGTVQQALSMPAGRILTCRFIDPGWTMVLSRAAGVVTETGGLLSHAAVICREFGIPAVLGIREVTRGIPHGSEIVVCGTTGRVRVLKGSPRSHRSDAPIHCPAWRVDEAPHVP